MGRASSGRSPAAEPEPQPASEHPDRLRSLARWAPALTHIGFLVVIVLAMSPYTYNLDDIKMSLYLILGPALGLLVLGAVALGAVPFPPKLVGIGLIAYGAAMLISTLTSEFSWAGWIRMPFYVASAGFFLGGLASGSRRETSRLFLGSVVVMLLVVNLLGFLQYDFFGRGKTALSLIYESFYGSEAPGLESSLFQMVAGTFALKTKSMLMSTIMNRDFYAGFCLLYAPMAACLVLISSGRAARAVGLLTIMFSLISIFLCQSKGEYFVAILVAVFFSVLCASAVRRSSIPRGHIGAWAVGMLIFLATLLFLKSPMLLGQLKSLSYSLSSREIIFQGAWKIFLAFPLLGGGPGTFKIFFPQHRTPDYFNHEISHLTVFSHNYFLDILSETGLLGMASYLLFAAPLAWLAFVALRRSSDMQFRLLMIGSLTGLMGIYGSNMTSPNARWPIGAVGLWSMLGFVAGLIRQSEGWRPAAAPAGFGASPEGKVSPAPGLAPKARAVLWGVGVLALIGLAASARESVRYWRGVLSYNDAFQRYQIVSEHFSSTPGGFADLTDRQRRVAIDLVEYSLPVFRETLKVYPEHLSAYYKLGSAENLMSRLKPEQEFERLVSALEVYQSLRRYAPDYAEVHYNIGVINFRLARIIEARLTDLPPDREDERAELEARKQGRSMAAIEAFQKIAAMSNRPQAILTLGLAYQNEAMFAEAIKLFEKGMNLYPERADFAEHYSRCATELGDFEAQTIALARLWNLRPAMDARYLYPALQQSLDRGFGEIFEQLARQALERNPVNASLHQMLVKYHGAEGNRDEALRHATAYMKLKGPNTRVYQEGLAWARTVDDAGLQSSFYRAAASQTLQPALRRTAEQWLAAHPEH